MKPVNFAVIGTGLMGTHHARNLAASSQTRLVAVADLASERAARVGEELNCQAFDNIDATLATPGVEAVVIATPEKVRAAPLKAVLERKLPVFLEKPLSADPEEAEELAPLVRHSGLPFQIGFQRRFDPGISAIKEALASAGPLEMLRSVTRDPEPPPTLEAGIDDGGMVFSTLIHDIDCAQFLGGPIAEVFARGTALIVPHDDPRWVDTALVSVRFASGALGVLEGSWRTSYGYDARAEVHAAGGSFEARGWPHSPIERHDRQGASVGHPQGFIERFLQAYRNELDAFARCIRNGIRPSPSVDDALSASRVAVAILESLSTGLPVKVRRVEA